MDNERAFLHSIVSPLAGARLLLDFALEDLQSGAGAEVLASLKEVSKGLERALALIEERRKEVTGFNSETGKG